MKLEDLTLDQYYKLIESGMLWEMYPEATGNYNQDTLNSIEEENKINMHYCYDPLAIRDASEYISFNNPHAGDPDVVEKRIYQSIQQCKSILNYNLMMDSAYYGTVHTSTLGYHVTFLWEDEDHIDIRVTVDASICKPHHVSIVDEEYLDTVCDQYRD